MSLALGARLPYDIARNKKVLCYPQLKQNKSLMGSYCEQVIRMKQQLSDYKINLEVVPIKCNNTNVIKLSKYLVLPSLTKHIDIRHHLIKDQVEKGIA